MSAHALQGRSYILFVSIYLSLYTAWNRTLPVGIQQLYNIIPEHVNKIVLWGTFQKQTSAMEYKKTDAPQPDVKEEEEEKEEEKDKGDEEEEGEEKLGKK